MPNHLTRRAFLRRGGHAALGLAALSALGACAEAENGEAGPTTGDPRGAAEPVARFPGQSITMLVYSGITERLYKDNFVPQFEAATGAKVTIDAAWTEGIARLQASPADNPAFDVVLTDPTQGLPAIQSGLFQQIDTDKIPNAKQFAPQLLDTSVWRDGWGLPFHSSAMTLATNTSARPQPYQSWAELLDSPPPQGVMLYNLPYMSVYTFAAMKAEKEGKVGQAASMLGDDPQGVMDFAVANRGLVKYFWPSTTDGVNALVNGEVAAGNMHGNGLLAPIRAGKPVAGVLPGGDVAYAQVFQAVPRGVRNLDLSIAAINHVASAEFQQALASSGEYSAAIPEIAQAQAAKDPVWAQAFPSREEEFAELRYYPYEALADPQIAARWDREVLRKG
ncbi:MAG: extracellular solute-binding protein [Actinomycetota bacterium]|nr:extracellular solute-binding protein [Actinomycetota bacterium]